MIRKFYTLLLCITAIFFSVQLFSQNKVINSKEKGTEAAYIDSKDLSSGLIAYYPFNGNSNDGSGNGNNGTENGGVALTTDRFGAENSAYSFDGIDDYISLGVIQNYISHSFSGWFKIQGETSSYGVIVSKLYNDIYYAKNSEIRIDGDHSNGFTISSQIGTGSIWEGVQYNPVDTSIWNHFVFIFDDTEKTLKLYLNSSLVESKIISGYSDVESTPTYIGARPYWSGADGTTFFFNGYIDDVRIYNRALTADEIRELYHEGDWSTVTDIDGNVYPTVKIGEQEWMAENLKTTQYDNGDFIDEVQDAGAWSGLTTGAYCWYNNDATSYKDTYGALYNWYAVADSRNICPAGWRVPSDEDWYIMENFIDPTINEPNSTEWRGTDGGTILKATSGWNNGGNGTDDYGFSALPGGYRLYTSSFSTVGIHGYWWSISDYDDSFSWNRLLNNELSQIYRSYYSNNFGFSIRCIKGEQAVDEFAGGSGTETDPWLISTPEQLGNIRNYLGSGHTDKYFLQINDIDLNGIEWQPIGYDLTNSFRAHFDGGNHIISNLTISEGESRLGLFGQVREATIQNIGLVNVSISGYEYVGALVGYVDVTTNISKCYSTGSINAYRYFGGLAGGLFSSDIVNCYSRCGLNGTSYVGGLVGYSSNVGTWSIIENCYSTGSVVGSTNIGGMVGYSSQLTVTNSYWDSETSGLTTSAGGASRTTSQMTSPYSSDTYEGWDFADTWGDDTDYSNNNGYPYLRTEASGVPTVETYEYGYVTSHTAKAGGEVLTDGGGEIYNRGVIWGYDTNLTESSHIGSAYDINTGIGSYEVILEPLTPGTTYYYRAFAINPSGWGYGDVYSFATNNAMNFCDAVDNCDLTYQHGGDFQWFGQSITTYDAIDAAQSGFVDNNQATYFTATFNNPGTISFYWKTSSQANSDFLKLYIDDVFMEEISGETDWIGAEYNMTDSPHTFKWEYIKDSEGSEGEDCGWVDNIVYIPSGFPEVTTNYVDNITSSSATVNYSVVNDGGNSIMERGVVWATWENPELENYEGITDDFDGTGTGTFHANLTGLTENTTYYVRAYASNIGTSYGSQLSFTTSQGSGFSKTFIVNMDRATYLYDDGTGTLVAGIFDPATDRVFISGNFSEESNWPIPGSDDTFELTPDPNNESYNQLIYTISLDLNEGEFQYKYFIFNNQSDPWDYGEWEGGPNRAIYIENGNDQNDSWGIINASDMVISQDQTITISAPGLYNINSWTWDFGEGAIPAQADGYGPHDVSYSTVGSKTITLALNSGEFTYTKENFIEVGNSPTVSDVGENELGTTYAVLGCIVNPNNFETTVKLEYGETSELGNEQTLPETYLGDTNHSIEVTLDGLTENTSYFYRFVAENIFGQTASEVTELRTACTYTIYANVPSGSQNVCGGGTYTYSTSSENAETFVWEINPESAGATESTSETAQISWNHTFSGDAQVRVRGVSGTCNSEWSNYLNIYVNNTISDIEISGETEACTTSEILYKLSRAANDSYQWEVTGGNIIAQTNQVATIRWNTSGNNLLRIIEDGEGGCPISSTLEVLVNSYVAPEVPQIHRKGSINILICTTPNMDYKWFKDGSVISGQTGQYVVARNNLGYYNVQITDDNNCPNTSNPLQVDTYAMAESVLSIFPNPTSGSFTIEALGEKVGAATVRISNSFGNIIFEQKVEKNDYLYQQQLNIPNLPQGIYIVSLAVEGDMPIKAKLTIY
ncbi:MAG TPA: FISUMP domain-containing protein [Tenuifilaceae bacterium]|nr:FISUMP domain-containing protein [Tenuifilaceae bacterium]